MNDVSSKEVEELKKQILTIQTELQNSKNVEEKRKMELELLKQKNVHLEQSLAKSESRLKCFSQSVVNSKFTHLIEEIDSLKKLRDDMHLDEALVPLLKNAVALVAEKRSIRLDRMTSYLELLKAENDLSNNQTSLKDCMEKENLEALVKQRDDSRLNLLDMADTFLKESEDLPFNARQKELEFTLVDIEKKYELHMSTSESNCTVNEAVQAYEDWRIKKIENVKDMQQSADLSSLMLGNSLESIEQKISLHNQPMLVEFGDVETGKENNIDELIEQYTNAVTKETAMIKDSNIDTEGTKMIMDIVMSLFQTINGEIKDIKTLRDELRDKYHNKKNEIDEWIKKKPDVSKLKETRSTLKGLKSKFRHKQADRRDYEEDSDENDQLAKIEEEIKLIRNQMHALFIEEKKLLGDLSQLSITHFPELPLQYPELGISSFVESNGLLQLRELEHYDHHSLPLISSSTSQPILFKTIFNQKPCVLKEYSLDANFTKDVIKSRAFGYSKCQHKNLLALDALFFDKAGRKAFLQSDFCGDGDMVDYIETRPSTKELRQVFLGLLNGLSTLHSQDYIYGCISPKNIFIKRDGKDITSVFKEPKFSKDEGDRFKDLAAYTSKNSYPVFEAATERPSKELDMYCFGLLMLWAYFPDGDYSKSVNSTSKNVSKDHEAVDILENLLKNDGTQRITAEEALKHCFFEVRGRGSQSPGSLQLTFSTVHYMRVKLPFRHILLKASDLKLKSEELLNTMKDLSDSFAIVEMTEQPSEVFNNVSNTNELNVSNERFGDAIDNEISKALGDETEKKPDDDFLLEV